MSTIVGPGYSGFEQLGSYSGAAARPRVKKPEFVSVWNEVRSWLLIWPMLRLIAGQAPYFSGPAKTAEEYQNGPLTAGPRSHAELYIYLFILACFCALGLKRLVLTYRNNVFLTAMLALSFFSAAWSQSPHISLQMAAMVTLSTSFACYVSATFPSDRLMGFLMFMGIVAGMLSAVFAILLPSYGLFVGYQSGGTGAWQGICNHKNTLGFNMLFLMTPAFFAGHMRKLYRVAYVLFVLALIGLSQSRGAWALTLLIGAFVGWLTVARTLRRKELPIFLTLSVITFSTILTVLIANFDDLARLMGKDPTMSGRTDIYKQVWNSILERPMLGYGVGGFWFPGSLESQRIGTALHWMNIGYAENGFLELGLQLGFVGIGLLIIMMGRAFFQGARLLRSPLYRPQVGWYLTTLTLTLLCNIDAGWFLSSDNLQWPLLVFACAGMEFEARRKSPHILNQKQALGLLSA